MSQTFWCVERGELSKKEIARRNRIAKKHGVDFTHVWLPGDGWKSWFAGRNEGFPFDKQTGDALQQDLERGR